MIEFSRSSVLVSYAKQPCAIISLALALTLGLALTIYPNPVFGEVSDRAVSEAPQQSREIQYILASDGYIVAFDTSPAWTWSTHQGRHGNILTGHSPNNYYPATSATVSYFPGQFLAANKTDLRQAAEVAIDTTLQSMGSKALILAPISYFEFDYYKGFHQPFQTTINGVKQDVDFYVGRFPKGQTLSLMLITQEDKLAHIRHLTQRIGNSLRPEGTPIQRFNEEKN